MRERQYGLMNQAFAAWFVESQGKSLGLGIVLGGLAVMVLFGIVRRVPPHSTIWGIGAAIIFLMIEMLIGLGVRIAALYSINTNSSKTRTFRDPILRIARQNGIPATQVYQVDASRQSNRIALKTSADFSARSESHAERQSAAAHFAAGDYGRDGARDGSLRSEPHL